MRYQAASSQQRPSAQLLCIPFVQGEQGAQPAGELPSEILQGLAPLLGTKDFTGKSGQTALWYPQGTPEQRWLLLGLGESKKLRTDAIRRAYAQGCQQARQLRVTEISLFMPKIERMTEEELLRGVVEGLELNNYQFTLYKASEQTLLEKATLLGVQEKALSKAQHWAEVVVGVRFARDLVNTNADEVTPNHLVERAQALVKEFPALQLTLFDEERLRKEKMGCILAVGGGARHAPALIQIEYRGSPDPDEHTVVIGKGVTFDTGGLNLKPTGSMEDMKCDMAGAAACLGLMRVLGTLKPACHVTVLIPTAENAIDSESYKPGDVIRSYAGKTIEITNTDAEGRLLLADALAYAVAKLHPSRMVDLATLTGGVIVALGHDVTGLMSNRDELAQELFHAGEATGERCWQLPLYEDYRTAMLSDIADLRNSAKARSASSITGGIFLKEFVGDVPWAHLDIAGTAFLSDGEGKSYGIKHATGVGVRLLAQWLEVT